MRKYQLFDDFWGPQKCENQMCCNCCSNNSNSKKKSNKKKKKKRKKKKKKQNKNKNKGGLELFGNCEAAQKPNCGTHKYICRLPSQRSHACRAKPFHPLPCVLYSFLGM